MTVRFTVVNVPHTAVKYVRGCLRDACHREAGTDTVKRSLRPIRRCMPAGGAVALCTWGGLASRQIGLPITKGPQTKGENGKGGKKGRL